MMSQDIETMISQSDAVQNDEASDLPYYVVSPAKYWLLYLGTAGLYGLYWSYKNWAQFKQATRGDQWPVARAIFAVFFIHELYRGVDARLKDASSKHNWEPDSLATLTVLALVGAAVLDRLAWREIGSPITDLVSMAFMPLIAYLRFQAQKAINGACDNPSGSLNSRVTIANIAWLALGGMLWLLVIVGFAIT